MLLDKRGDFKRKLRLFRKGIGWYNRLLIMLKSRKLRKRYYSTDCARATNDQKMVIMMLDGRIAHGGFADRLQGIVSAYKVAKDLGYQFKINYVSPFNLTDLLNPNDVDWSVDESEISHNTKDVGVYMCSNFLDYMTVDKSYRTVERIMKKPHKQVHIYSNSALAKRMGEYSTLYKELFKFNPLFEESLNSHISELGGDYIAVSTRFGETLGDFVDSFGKALPELEQEDLLRRCRDCIEKIHEEYPASKLFLTSDSRKYIEYMRRELPYTYSLSGEREHIDYAKSNDFEQHKLTFLDFYLIAKSSRSIQIKSKEMYAGGFSHSASAIENISHEIVEI